MRGRKAMPSPSPRPGKPVTQLASNARAVTLSKGLCSVAGEYHVCAELSRRGFLAALTLKNAEGTDILASRPNSGRAISIQVKTTQGGTPSWMLNEKCERNMASEFFFVLVRLKGESERPDFHVVPSEVVAKTISKGHRKWLTGTKRDGSPRKDTSMRRFDDFGNQYIENWSALG